MTINQYKSFFAEIDEVDPSGVTIRFVDEEQEANKNYKEDSNLFAQDSGETTKNQTNLTKLIEKKKRFIHDGKFTDIQKRYVYAIISIVDQFCDITPTIKLIISMIVDYFQPVTPARYIYRTILGSFPEQVCVLSPDNQWITNSESNTSYPLIVWNVATGEKKWTLLGHSNEIRQCVFTADSQLIISASYDHTLKLWSVLTGALLHTFTGHTDWVMSCALSTANEYLLSTGMDKTVRLWALETKQCIRVFYGHEWTVSWGQFFAQDQMIVSTDDQNIRIWDIESGECRQSFSIVSDIRTQSLSGDEQLFLVGGDNVSVWDITKGTLICRFTDHQPNENRGIPLQHQIWITSAIFVCEDTCVASQDEKGIIYIWRINDGKIIHCLDHYDSRIPLQYSYWDKKNQNQEYIIVSHKAIPYHVDVVAVQSGDILVKFERHKCYSRVKLVQVSTDGHFLISWDEDLIRTFLFRLFTKNKE